MPQPSGFLVTAVAKESPAEQMGLKGGQLDAVISDERLLIGGDIILEINGIEVGNNRKAYRTVFTSLAVHTAPVRFKIMRAGKILELIQNR